jgi:hypothetical protein
MHSRLTTFFVGDEIFFGKHRLVDRRKDHDGESGKTLSGDSSMDFVKMPLTLSAFLAVLAR